MSAIVSVSVGVGVGVGKGYVVLYGRTCPPREYA